MNNPSKFFTFIFLTIFSYNSFSQEIIEEYQAKKNERLRTGTEAINFLPFIQSGYTLMLPKEMKVTGVLILLEDSGHDKKNKNAKQLYNSASEKGFAVLSVSSEIPFDFYFSDLSALAAHQLIQEVFTKYNLPNKNIFFLGASLVGHRAMRFIKYMKEGKYEPQLNVEGIVVCNFTMDWTRKWNQHEREIRIKHNDLWEPKFINYMLETHLNGTPKTTPDTYHQFSAYSYFDEKNENIKFYKDYAVRAYIEPAIKYKLTKQLKTLYENNSTDIVGFLAELELVGNEKTDLIVLQPDDNPLSIKNAQATWDAINKDELMDWILKQIEK